MASNRGLAILGTSEHCIATNPSDMNVAMAALEATIHVRGPKGERSIPIGDFHVLPGNTPQRETVLEPGDLITHVTLPPPAPGNRSLYLKLRDRTSYEFALASAAVVITAANGKITRARIAMGGVGTKPWRSTEAEGELTDQTGDRSRLSGKQPSGVARRKTAKPKRLQGRAGQTLPRPRAETRDATRLTSSRTCHSKKLQRHRRSVATLRASMAR